MDFHSIRLEERFIRTIETFSKQPDASIWEASEDRAEALAKGRAIYRDAGEFRWLEALERSIADIPEGTKVITVCDRERDRHELFTKAQSLNEVVLIPDSPDPGDGSKQADIG
jgi:hypothetical protein